MNKSELLKNNKKIILRIIGAILISNILFFSFLKLASDTDNMIPSLPAGWSEIYIEGDLRTSFVANKIVSLKTKNIIMSAIFINFIPGDEFKKNQFLVAVEDKNIPYLLNSNNYYQIVPLLNESLAQIKPKESLHYELHY